MPDMAIDDPPLRLGMALDLEMLSFAHEPRLARVRKPGLYRIEHPSLLHSSSAPATARALIPTLGRVQARLPSARCLSPARFRQRLGGCHRAGRRERLSGGEGPMLLFALTAPLPFSAQPPRHCLRTMRLRGALNPLPQFTLRLLGRLRQGLLVFQFARTLE
jgi:hypothetical protein